MLKQIRKLAIGYLPLIALALVYAILKTTVELLKLTKGAPTQVSIVTQPPDAIHVAERSGWFKKLPIYGKALVPILSFFVFLGVLVPGYWAVTELFFPSPFSSTPPPEPLPTDVQQLGKLSFFDFLEYCQTSNGGVPFVRPLWPNAFALRCRVVEISAFPNAVFYAISVNKACSQKYGDSAFAHAYDTSNPYGWECLRSTKQSGD